MAEGRPTGVLVMAYGTPRSREELPAYYTHIRHGSPPPEELIDELAARYDAIGGVSPLAERTDAQRQVITESLEHRFPGRFVVEGGYKHAPPFIEDGVRSLAEAGVDEIVGLVLAPHYSRASVGQYHDRAQTACDAHGVRFEPINSWHLLGEYVAFLSAAVRAARDEAPERHKVLFSAHSLPERTLDGDPYPAQLRATAETVAHNLGLGPWADWTLCWQSAGRTADAWRGPDVNEVLVDLAGTGRAEGVVVCPQGFVADGLEVLYDIDVQARQTADRLGLQLVRTRSLNDDRTVMAALADLIAARAAEARDLSRQRSP